MLLLLMIMMVMKKMMITIIMMMIILLKMVMTDDVETNQVPECKAESWITSNFHDDDEYDVDNNDDIDNVNADDDADVCGSKVKLLGAQPNLEAGAIASNQTAFNHPDDDSGDDPGPDPGPDDIANVIND